MRKIGSITPLWNQELFIGPHFEMLKDLDRNLVLMQEKPLPSYHNEHGYSVKADMSEPLLKQLFPNVEIVKAMYPPELDFACGLYNEGLAQMQDMDIVLRLDPDMLWTKKDWKAFIDLIRNTDFDCYRMDFAKDSINYYQTGRYDHGLKDAQEFDALGVDPKKFFTGILDYPSAGHIIKIPDWMCHHFRGWNKPKSTPPDWHTKIEPAYLEQFGNKGGWFECPDEIKDKMEAWLRELSLLKKSS